MSPRDETNDETPEWEKSARARVGSTLAGKWRLDAVLGVGGMSAVYAATHRNGHRAAIKAMRSDRLSTTSSRGRLVREAYAANAVARDGAVAVLDDGIDGGVVFLVMDLLEGETLHARARRHGGRLPIDDLLRIAEDFLVVVAAAHSKHIVHRDLKPENVFVETSGRVRVLDFGLARFDDGSDETLTHSNATLGTPAFMSPEQAWGRAREADARSDVWGVGATLFTLLTGQFVHPSHSSGEMLIRTATEAAPSLASLVPQMPPAIVNVVDRALAFRAADRFRDARAMLDAWRAARAEWERAPGDVSPELTSVNREASATLPPRTDASRGRGSDAGEGSELLSAATSLRPPPLAPPRSRRIVANARWAGLATAFVALASAVVAQRSSSTQLRAGFGPVASIVATALASAPTIDDAPPAAPSTAPVDSSSPPIAHAPSPSRAAAPAMHLPTTPPSSATAIAPVSQAPSANPSPPDPLEKILERRK